MCDAAWVRQFCANFAYANPGVRSQSFNLMRDLQLNYKEVTLTKRLEKSVFQSLPGKESKRRQAQGCNEFVLWLRRRVMPVLLVANNLFMELHALEG